MQECGVAHGLPLGESVSTNTTAIGTDQSKFHSGSLAYGSEQGGANPMAQAAEMDDTSYGQVSSSGHESCMSSNFRGAFEHGFASQPPRLFEPRLVFFYGSLTIPTVLKRVLKLNCEPELRPAYIRGYQIRMAGQYPALLPAEPTAASDSKIDGMAYVVETEAHLRRLEKYETDMYRLDSCIVNVVDESARRGWTFFWDEDVNWLKDGMFDAAVFKV